MSVSRLVHWPGLRKSLIIEIFFFRRFNFRDSVHIQLILVIFLKIEQVFSKQVWRFSKNHVSKKVPLFTVPDRQCGYAQLLLQSGNEEYSFNISDNSYNNCIYRSMWYINLYIILFMLLLFFFAFFVIV